MSGFNFRSLTFMLLIAFLVWSSNFEACIARRGRHWRHQNRGTSTSSSSLYNKKKGKNHGSSHHHQHKSGSKPKAPPHHKAAPPVAQPPPPTNVKPVNEPAPSPPKSKGYNNGGHSASFNVMDFGAKGDGSTDDTKVCKLALLIKCSC